MPIIFYLRIKLLSYCSEFSNNLYTLRQQGQATAGFMINIDTGKIIKFKRTRSLSNAVCLKHVKYWTTNTAIFVLLVPISGISGTYYKQCDPCGHMTQVTLNIAQLNSTLHLTMYIYSLCWYFLRSICSPNLNFVALAVPEILRVNQNLKVGHVIQVTPPLTSNFTICVKFNFYRAACNADAV